MTSVRRSSFLGAFFAHMTSRRQFLRTGSLAALATGVGVPRWLAGQSPADRPTLITPTSVDITPRAGDPLLKTLAMRALDAAKAAGATYADVRLTVTRTQAFYYANPPMDSESIAVGVRALANGAWGFVASPDWTPDTMDRLGRVAVEQAKGNAWSGRPPIELTEAPPAVTGEWTAPIRRDPFSIAVEEKLDYIRSAEAYARTFRNGNASSVIIFERQERTFASSVGSFCTQTVYNTLGNGSFFAVSVGEPVTQRSGGRGAQFVSPSGAGYELFSDAKLLDQVPQLYEQAREMLTAQPLDNPARLDVVFDGYALSRIVNASVGAALELDRALGLEANASGTSYLAPVETIAGTRLAPPAVTITGERSSPTGAASVKWDDEGVAPSAFTLIDKGLVNDYATNREHASALSSWYRAKGRPVRSNGCAGAQSAMTVPIVHAPNLTLQPGTTDASVQDLIAQVDDGVAFLGGGIYVDFQQLNGQGAGEMAYRIKKGKVVGTIGGAAYLFRSPDLWKDLIALGGAQTSVTRGVVDRKGQPMQETVRSITAPAAHFRNVRVMDIRADASPAQQQLQQQIRGGGR